MNSKLSDIYSMKWKEFDPLEVVWDEAIEDHPFLLKNYDLLVKSNLRVGIEAEIENHRGVRDSAIRRAFWRTLADGSLRDNGIEYCSEPVYDRYIVAALNILEKTLDSQKEVGDGVRFSDLCGLHIHLNVREFSYNQLANFLFMYTLWEASLFRISGARDQNIFCVPIRVATPVLRDFFCAILRGTMESETLKVLVSPAENTKYSALNWQPIRTFGTVEFRHAKGTGSSKEILSWVNIILSLGEAAKKAQFRPLMEQVFSLNTNSEYEKITQEVFGEHSKMLEWTGLGEEMSEGVSKLKAWCISVNDIYVEDGHKKDADIQRKKENRCFLEGA